MKLPQARWAFALVVAASSMLPAFALPFHFPRIWECDRLNRQLHGHVCDFTNNHGVDHRIWSPALGKKRDMYVYLPPGYDGVKKYPLMIWLHGFSQDEKNTKKLSKKFDEAVFAGKFPPMVIACPDGTFKGEATIRNSGSFFINGIKGRYEDYLAEDIYNFLTCHFAVRPEREAHVIAGASMGGTSAYAIAFKHREKFGVIVGIMPLLDLRFADGNGDHFGKFDPNNLGRIDHYNPKDPAGRIMGVKIKYGTAMKPLFGDPANVEAKLPGENPADMLDMYNVQPGEFKMFISFGERDNFNGNNEARNFLYLAEQRGVTADVVTDPTGKHNKRTGMKFFGSFSEWLMPVMAPYVP